jgi:predicted DNA-binding transcriptional regulator AlpA
MTTVPRPTNRVHAERSIVGGNIVPKLIRSIPKTSELSQGRADAVEPRLLKLPEVCRRLDVSRSTVLREERRGALPSVRVGQRGKRWRESVLVEYVDSRSSSTPVRIHNSKDSSASERVTTFHRRDSSDP